MLTVGDKAPEYLGKDETGELILLVDVSVCHHLLGYHNCKVGSKACYTKLSYKIFLVVITVGEDGKSLLFRLVIFVKARHTHIGILVDLLALNG